MIIFTLILGLGLRLISLNQSLWLDEATSALTTKMSLADFFTKFMPGDFHPPLYYLLLRVWSLFFGTSEIALRSLSILFGVGTVYLVYLIGKKIINSEVGLIAGILLATSGLHIYYSQEARMYAMSTFLVALFIFSLVKIIKNESRVEYWLIFALTLALIGLTDYLPLLILAPIWIFIIIGKYKPKFWFKFVASHIIIAISFLILLPLFIKQFTSGISVTSSSPAWVQVLGTFSLKDILLIPVKFAIGRISFDNKFIYAGFVCLILFIFAFLIYKSRSYFKSLQLIYLWLAVPLAIALVISLKIPVLNYFRFLFVLPAFYLIVASGVSSFKKKKTIILLIVIFINLISTFIYLTNMKFQRENWRGAVHYVESHKSQNSPVIFPANSQMEAYHYYAPSAKVYGPEAMNKLHNQIWLMRYAQPISDPTDSTRIKIDSLGYKKVQELDFNGVVVWLYNR